MATMMTVMMMADNVCRDLQAKAREAREQRRAQLGQAHNFIISLVADHLDLDQNSVEEFVIDNVKVTLSVSSLYCSFQLITFSNDNKLKKS